MNRPAPPERRRWRRAPLWSHAPGWSWLRACALGALSLGAACGTSASGRLPPRPKAVVITASSGAVTTVRVGALVVVELVSASYRRDGHLVPWGTPMSSDPGVVVPSGAAPPRRCPRAATCTVFAAVRAGTAVIGALGPSGIVCARGGNHCVAVAPVVRRFDVVVTAS